MTFVCATDWHLRQKEVEVNYTSPVPIKKHSKPSNVFPFLRVRLTSLPEFNSLIIVVQNSQDIGILHMAESNQHTTISLSALSTHVVVPFNDPMVVKPEKNTTTG